MSKSTMTDLVAELEKRNKDGKYDFLISEAKAGEYHDFKNKKHDCGKVGLVNDLASFPELEDIRWAVINGEYDEKADEQDKELMRQDIINNLGPEKAKPMLKLLGLDK